MIGISVAGCSMVSIGSSVSMGVDAVAAGSTLR